MIIQVKDQTTLSNAFLLTVSLVVEGSVKLEPRANVTWETLFAFRFWNPVVGVPTVAGLPILTMYYAWATILSWREYETNFPFMFIDDLQFLDECIYSASEEETFGRTSLTKLTLADYLYLIVKTGNFGIQLLHMDIWRETFLVCKSAFKVNQSPCSRES